MILENKQALGLWFRCGGLIINVCLNLFLIPKYGTKGAAIATTISYVIPPFLIGTFIPIVRKELGMCIKSYLIIFRLIGRYT